MSAAPPAALPAAPCSTPTACTSSTTRPVRTTPQTATPFNLLVWRFSEAKDSLRLYTHQDHLSGDGLVDTDFEAQDVMEYSVFGCDGSAGGCADAADWVFLSDVVAFADVASGKPTYTFAGTEAAVVYRGGSAEFGLINAYTRDYHFGTAYNFYGMRSSSVSFAQNDATPSWTRDRVQSGRDPRAGHWTARRHRPVRGWVVPTFPACTLKASGG